MTLESSKNLGIVGSILVVVSPLGSGPFSGLIAIVGLIMVLMALKGLSVQYKEERIFDNALYGVIIAVVGVAVFIAVAAVTAFAALSMMGLNWTNVGDWARFGSSFSNLTNLQAFMPFLAAILVALAVLFVFLVVSAVFLRRSMSVLSTKTKVHMFSTAGLLMLIGAVLTIIAVGLFLIWVAWILVAVGFLSIKTGKA